MIPALQALKRLREGNRHFVSDIKNCNATSGHVRRIELAAGQEPFAIIATLEELCRSSA